MVQSNEPTVEQKNEAIALFMGYEKYEDKFGIWFKKEGLIKCLHPKLQGLNYHKSWDALIPVWDKLRAVLFQCMPASGFNDGFDKYSDAWKTACFNAEIDKAHNVVFQAIQWLNQQKQTYEQ